MKHDIRLGYPLWMMGFIVLLGVFAYSIHSPSAKFVNNEDEISLTVILGVVEGFLFFGSLLLYLVLLIVFTTKIQRYNKTNPHQKISMFSLRPPEYLEADEGMTHITRRAVQKVYSFYSLALPLFATIVILMPLPRLVIIYSILTLAFIQYWIYYAEVRKHFKGEEE